MQEMSLSKYLERGCYTEHGEDTTMSHTKEEEEIENFKLIRDQVKQCLIESYELREAQMKFDNKMEKLVKRLKYTESLMEEMN